MGLSKEERRLRIRRRIRKTVSELLMRSLSVFRSNKEIYAQLIDDATGPRWFQHRHVMKV